MFCLWCQVCVLLGMGKYFGLGFFFKAVRKLCRVKQSILLLILRAGIRVIKRVKVRTRVL